MPGRSNEKESVMRFSIFVALSFFIILALTARNPRPTLPHPAKCRGVTSPDQQLRRAYYLWGDIRTLHSMNRESRSAT